MIIVSGIMTVDPSSHDRMVELARTVSTESLKEPGCRAYGLWADPDVRGRFRIFEEWDSQEALTEHFGTPHFAAFGSSLGDLALGSMDIHRYIDPRGGGPVLTTSHRRSTHHGGSHQSDERHSDRARQCLSSSLWGRPQG